MQISTFEHNSKKTKPVGLEDQRFLPDLRKRCAERTQGVNCASTKTYDPYVANNPYSERRGPLRPLKLQSLRRRQDLWLSTYWFSLIDGLLILGVCCLVTALSLKSNLMSLQSKEIIPLLILFFFIVYLKNRAAIYSFARGKKFSGQALDLLWLVLLSTGAAALGALVLMVNPTGFANLWMASVAIFISLIMLHALWWQLMNMWRKASDLTPQIIILGATASAEKLIKLALKQGDLHILGVFDDRGTRLDHDLSGVPILGNLDALLHHRLVPFIDQIVIALGPEASNRVDLVKQKLKTLPTEISLLPQSSLTFSHILKSQNPADQKVIIKKVQTSPQAFDKARAFHKRLQDLILGTLALIILAPILVIITVLIKLDSQGPVIFRQNRHGYNQETIHVWKFRTMYHTDAKHPQGNDLNASLQVYENDPRVTRLGRFLRRTSLDELPQLFNVLKGEMSLVGPRPHAIGMKTEDCLSSVIVDDYAMRLKLKPGITGWAAIKGSRGPLHDKTSVEQRIFYDRDYIDRQSFWFDLYILLMTVPVLLGDRKSIR
jgi:polysaccharide biosynthesis protein PslA